METETRTRLIDLTVTYLLDVRAMYLAAGANPLKHWDQLQSRLMAAARSSTTASEWGTRLLRGLQIGSPSSSTSSALVALVDAVGPDSRDWLDLIEREYGLVLAKARLESERRRTERAERGTLPVVA